MGDSFCIFTLQRLLAVDCAPPPSLHFPTVGTLRAARACWRKSDGGAEDPLALVRGHRASSLRDDGVCLV